MKKSFFKKAMLGLAAVAMVGGLAACGNKSSSSSSSKSEKTITFLPPAMVSPFYKSTIDGAKAEAKAQGYKLNVLAPQKEDDYEGLLKIVEDSLSKGTNAIAICTTDDKTMAAAVKKANRDKVPVVVFNSISKVKDAKVYSYVGYDQKKAGASVAKWLGTKYSDKKLNVGILEGLPGVFTENREGGFVDAAKQYKNIKIVAKQPANWDRGKALDTATNMYQGNKDINTFYGLSDEMALGAASAAKQAGIKNAITIGIDGNPNTLAAIKKGSVTGSVYTNPKMMGKRAVQDAIKAIKGQKKANVINEIPTVVVDKSNVAKYTK